MSEKRFRANFDVSIYDSETEEYISASENGLKEIAKRMNEQQSTIIALKEENERLQQELEENKAIINFCSNGDEDEDLHRLIKENEQLRQSYKYADELLEEIREVFEKNGVETGYNKRILETCFSALYENEQLRQKLKTICNTCCYDCEEKWCEKI